MILALIVLQLSVLVAANPFHKYPFVFLLDVGNEELEKTNTEQIRLNIPGGSVALRYPAIGNGNTIGHIRVSGIDFGTDLKANIVDGGPGYKYVVLVFMGNQGVPYDAVVTVQTVNNGDLNPPDISGSVSDTDGYQTQVDVNNSAEDLSDDSAVTNTVENESSDDVEISNIQMNAEQMQSSSNVYNYAQSDSIENGDGYDEEIVNHGSEGQDDESEDGPDNDEIKTIDESDDESDQKDIILQYSDNIEQINEPYNQKGEESDDDDNGEEISSQLGPSMGKEIPNDVYSYENLRQRFNGEPENDEQNYSMSDQQEPLDYEDPDETQPIFNDGEDHSSYKYKDTNNNNYVDSDDSYAVAY